MADPKELRERAERFRRVARTLSKGPKGWANPYLIAMADHYERAAARAESHATAGDKPRTISDGRGAEPGQRYRRIGSPFSVWEVVEVITYPGQHVPRVRLSRVGSPKDFETVSLGALRDRQFYEPV